MKLSILPKGEGVGDYQLIDSDGWYVASVDASWCGKPDEENKSIAESIVTAVNFLPELRRNLSALYELVPFEQRENHPVLAEARRLLKETDLCSQPNNEIAS